MDVSYIDKVGHRDFLTHSGQDVTFQKTQLLESEEIQSDLKQRDEDLFFQFHLWLE